MAPVIIDQEEGLRSLLEHITERARTERNQLVFIDLEGVNLSRSGTVAIMQLLLPPSPTVYLVDIHQLKENAFETATADGTNLKSVLQSQDIFKVFFAIRNDSDALYAHFGINVAGIIDLQVIEYATRAPRGKFLNGLARCISKDLVVTSDWSVTKAKGRQLFAPEAGWRPIAEDIIKYCEQDVMLMPQLLATYGPKLQAGVAAQIQNIVDERIKLSKTADFNEKGRHMAVGPYLAPTRFPSGSASPEVNLVRSARLRDLCRLEPDLTDDFVARFGHMHVQAADRTESYEDALDPNHMVEPGHQPHTKGCTPSTADSAIATALIASMEQNVSDSSSEEVNSGWRTVSTGRGYGNDFDRDFTACSADDCGYCGRCGY